MQAALHGATFPKAKEVRASMTRQQMRETSGFDTESYAYDFRTRHNLKQHRGER